jgi:hypothetical protein
MQAVRLDPKNEQAWLWLSGFVDTAEKRRQCFERVLALNPDNEVARWGLAKLMTDTAAEPIEVKGDLAPTPEEPAQPEPEELPQPDPEPVGEVEEVLEPTPTAAEETAEIWEEEEKSGRSWVLPFAIILVLFIAIGYL